LRAFGERAVARVPQPAFHVPEGIQVGDEFDAERCAGRVEFADLRGRERRSILPSVLMAREREGMFDVELKLIDAQSSERADEVEQLRLRRHFAARHIEHEPADREVGTVEDFEAGKGGGRLRVDLPQGLGAVKEARRVTGSEQDALAVDGERVAVGA